MQSDQGTILTPDQRLRVYVSAAFDELGEESTAARRSIEALRLIPVSTEMGARPHAPRDVYRSYLEQSQIFIGIYGSSYGWTEPGRDISDIEDEYLLSEGRPRLLYLQEVGERDARLNALLDRIKEGAHSYKRFSTPEELGSLIADDLALLLTESFSEAVSLVPGSDEVEQSPPTIPQAVLPQHATSMVGRDLDVEEITALLTRADVRLVTLTGPGGIGKTRLAFEVVARSAHLFADGVQFALLAPLHDPNLVPAAIAQALAVREAPDRSTLEVVKELVRDQEVLILLDNFEHVIEAASLLAELLRDAPRLNMIVTSRSALQLLGEHEYVVRPLMVPRDSNMTRDQLSHYGAVSLFVDRASSANRPFELTEANANAVVEIVAQLDGLPLAIELAAARARSLPPKLLLERLQSRLDLLSRGPRDLPERQQTLRALLDWDYELLAEDERTLFRRLSVFARGFTLDAARKVGMPDLDELDLLELVESLLRKSLVHQGDIVQGEPRFAMLNTLREYAFEKLEQSGEADDARRCHSSYFASLAVDASKRLRDPDQMHWLDVLEAERDNMRLALRWSDEANDVETRLRLAGALARFWESRGYLTEGQRWLERVLSNTGSESDPTLRADALDGAGILSRSQGELKRARSHLEEGVALRRRLGDRSALGTTLRNLGNVIFDVGDLVTTRELYEESLDLYKEVSDEGGIASVLNNLGVLATYEQRWIEAERLYEESLSFARANEDVQGIARGLMNLGDVKAEQGDFVLAARYLQESFVLFQKLKSRWDIAYLLEGMGNALRAQDRPEEAAKMLGAAEILRERLGAPLPPSERAPFQRIIEMLRSQMDPDSFTDAWAKGRSMDMDEAVSYALSLRHA